MAHLVLINGAPGSGKSALARRYVTEHPLALSLDIDVVRGLLGGWLDHAAEAGQLARRMAIAMAREHLRSGHDVVVPQFLGRLEFILSLERLATETAVAFVEVALLSSAQEVEERFRRRTAESDLQAHRDAAALLARGGGTRALADMCDALLAVVAARPRTIALATRVGDLDQAYADLLAAIEARTGM